MTDEEIDRIYVEVLGTAGEHAQWLPVFARRVAEIEREACAKACEGDLSMVAWQCADAIRARGEK